MAASDAESVQVLGIRHHGPGSARSVLQALDELQPDLVIIEGPPELDELMALAASPDLVPPVAALIYVSDEPRRAAFYPFASFSPEWVALRWAIGHDVTARFADLPAVNMLAPSVADAGDQDEVLPVDRFDPIGRLAGVAGYDDPERWWEDAVEQRSSSTVQQFSLLAEAMAAVRAGDAERSAATGHSELLRREAAMRKIIRAEQRQGRERIAVVCGAYHAPALQPANFPSAAADNKLLTKLPRVRVTATWAPWTSGRLATASGYGAGITSPGWYAHLFHCWESDRSGAVVATWLTRVARSLRGEGLDAPPASVVDAARLADALAAVRGRPSVGLAELNDATQSVLCGGSALPLQLITGEVIIGTDLGQVPDSAPLVPLAQDLTRLQRKLRLKPSAAPTAVTLDLRKESQRERSLLLHQLRLLGIDWGRQVDAGGTTGTFKEAWRLQWQPEFAVALVEAGLYGTTVLSAAEACLAEQARGADLALLGSLTEQALIAELPQALAAVTAALAEQTARQRDTLALLRAIGPLARTERYGNVRRADTTVVAGVLGTVVTRAAVGLRTACSGIDDNAAEELQQAIEQAHRGINLSHIGAEEWAEALSHVAADDGLHGLIGGRVNRILTDSGRVSMDEAAMRLSRRLSRAAPASGGAAWLDGFLTGDASLLLHDQQLLAMIDSWVSDLAQPNFDDLVPLLRRTFSRFEPAERRQLGNRLLHLDEHDRADPDTDTGRIDVDRAWPVVQRVAGLLGLEVT